MEVKNEQVFQNLPNKLDYIKIKQFIKDPATGKIKDIYGNWINTPLPIVVECNVGINSAGNLQKASVILVDEDGYILGNIDYTGIQRGKNNISLYFIEQPFDSMMDNLLPLTIASTARLLRNYYRFNY